MYLNPAWRRCSDRFEEVRQFIDSSSSAPQLNQAPALRSALYGSWVLMTYGACQFSLNEIGHGCMAFLGDRYKNPGRMPIRVLRSHEKMTLDGVRRLMDGDASKQALAQQMLQDMYSGTWASQSLLLSMERNVWPSQVREWLKRLGVEDGDMSWMKDPAPGISETYESRMAELVEERNPIAHGHPPARLLGSQLMKDWLNECREFMERCAMTVELHLSNDHRPRLARIGVVNRNISFGNKTIPLGELKQHVRVGDHVLLANSSSDRRKVARVESIKSNGIGHSELPAGHKAVAIGLSKPHQGCGIYLVP